MFILSIFLFLAVTVTGNPIAAPIAAGFDLEQAITTLNVTRLSKLPSYSKYRYNYTLSPDLLFTKQSTATITASEFGVKCETSAASPLTRDVVRAFIIIKNLPPGSKLCQTRPWPLNNCVQTASKDTAATGICGNWGLCIDSVTAVEFMLLIVDMCQSGDKVGGLFDLNHSNGRLIVYHS